MILVYAAVILALLAGSARALMFAHEEKQAFDRAREAERLMAQKQRFESLMQAQSESRERLTRSGHPSQIENLTNAATRNKVRCQ